MKLFNEWPSWFDGILHTAEEDTSLPSESQDVNIVDPQAVGNKVRPITLALFPEANGAILDLTWKESNFKVFSQTYPSQEDAKANYSKLSAALLQINNLILEGKMEEAEMASSQVLESYAHESPQTQLDTVPATETQAQLRVSIILPPLPKTGGKATVQNIFFTDVDSLMEYMDKMKSLQPTPQNLGDGLLPELAPHDEADKGPLAPSNKGPLVPTPAKPSALEQMVEEQVKDQVKSSLDQRARAIFEDKHAEAVKVLRSLGRSWEEIKDFFNRYLKYEWDDIDTFLEQFQNAEEGVNKFNPGVEKVKRELEDEGDKGKNTAPERLDLDTSQPIALPSSSLQTTISKQADMVRDPDTLRPGNQIQVVRTVMSKEGTIVHPDTIGTIVSTTDYHVVIDSPVGFFTLAKSDCVKLYKTASLSTTSEKYYLDPKKEYDWEQDLVDEISGQLGDKSRKWDFTSPAWEVQYDPVKGPYVEIKRLAGFKVEDSVLHIALGQVLVTAVQDNIQVEDIEGNEYWVHPSTLVSMVVSEK